MSGGEQQGSKLNLDRFGKLLAPNSFPKQLAAGTASGWLTGVVMRHAGKGVALALGSGIIIYQIAHHQGYVKQDWSEIKQLAQKKSADLSRTTPAYNKLKAFALKNKVFTAGFCGGFLIGLAL